MIPNNVMDVFRDILAKFDDEGIAYMIVGSVSSIIYGEPRMTKDLDIVVNIRGILANTDIDTNYLLRWIGALGLVEFWDAVGGSTSPQE